MITEDVQTAQHFVDQFRALIDFSAFPDEIRQEFDALARTATSERFPGAMLMLPRVGKRSLYYALANDAAEWRRLRPLLIAYVGPTLTSFQGWPEPLLPHAIAAEALLSTAGFHVVARLVPGEDDKVQRFTRRSFERMVGMVVAAPTTTTAVPQSTDRLLAHFADCLNGNDYASAQQILEQCERELRVDALNLLFLRVRLLSWFGNWHAIVDMPEFRSLCHTRRPQAVTAALQEAVYQVWVHQQGDIPALGTVWTDQLRPDFLSLLQLPILPSASRGVLTLYALEALTVTTRNRTLEAAVLAQAAVIPDLIDALTANGRTGDEPTSEPAAPAAPAATLPAAQQALVEAERSNTLETIARALLSIEALSADERANLLASAPFRSLWQSLEAENHSAPPATWQEWFKRLDAPEFTDALHVLTHAVSEWPAALLQDPVDIASFERALQEVPETSPASDRLADALPALVNWTLQDPAFPRPSMLPVYDTLLFHLMVGVRRSSAVFESAAVLIRALLSLGLNQSRYRSLLDDCLMLNGEAMSKRTVYWMLDVLEETLLNPCANEEARRAFWYAACTRLMQLKAFFSPGQKIVFDRLATDLGWPAQWEQEERLAKVTADSQRQLLQSALDGSFVAIYTLTESAARQATTVLKELAPTLRVESSHDKVASITLKNLAHQADIFVMVAASAKHAATGYIQQERQGKPTLYANGRGFSSIVRAIENHVLGGD